MEKQLRELIEKLRSGANGYEEHAKWELHKAANELEALLADSRPERQCWYADNVVCPYSNQRDDKTAEGDGGNELSEVKFITSVPDPLGRTIASGMAFALAQPVASPVSPLNEEQGTPAKYPYDWRWMRLRGYLKEWLTPHQYDIAKECLEVALKDGLDLPTTEQRKALEQIVDLVNTPYAWKIRDIARAALGAVEGQGERDVRNLINSLSAHMENTGEYLEDEDMGVFKEIASRCKIALPRKPPCPHSKDGICDACAAKLEGKHE